MSFLRIYLKVAMWVTDMPMLSFTEECQLFPGYTSILHFPPSLEGVRTHITELAMESELAGGKS